MHNLPRLCLANLFLFRKINVREKVKGYIWLHEYWFSYVALFHPHRVFFFLGYFNIDTANWILSIVFVLKERCYCVKIFCYISSHSIFHHVGFWRAMLQKGILKNVEKARVKMEETFKCQHISSNCFFHKNITENWVKAKWKL